MKACDSSSSSSDESDDSTRGEAEEDQPADTPSVDDVLRLIGQLKPADHATLIAKLSK